MLRPTPLHRYLLVMRSLGFDKAQVLDGSGISAEALEDPQYLVDVSAYLRVVENMVRMTGDTGIGIDMGLARELGDFGILGYASLACRTARHSMEAFWSRYGDALGVLAKVKILDTNTPTQILEIETVNLSAPNYRFFVEETLFMLLKVGGQVSGIQAKFENLEFAYPEPPYSHRYVKLFNCPIRFDASRTRASLSRAWLDQPLRTTDGELVSLYDQHLQHLKRQIESSGTTGARLRSLFLKLGGRLPNLAHAANAMGLSSRTLRRQLQQEGSSYRRIVEEFRLELTLEYLKSSRISTKQLCELVGFDDVNAFRRAFKKWTGQTVREYCVKFNAPSANKSAFP